ncbi:N-acetylmuramic acid 6-phosphate etherase [Glaciecola sp.]|jgi:N-acetylmuramic acid 6-phosphate etherase|nr:N-acetylmuramic acid 6-phosphate etherase [Glaciecola sp.]
MRIVKIQDLQHILSESRHPDSMDIDMQSTNVILQIINSADQTVPVAVAQALPQISAAVDVIVKQLRLGGRLIYLGAGTSGRLGILDAVECRPTFSVDDELVQGIIAGGEQALTHAVEGAEDDINAAAVDLAAISFNAKDVLVGIAASGRTPYVIGGLNYATQLGAANISVSCNPNGKINTLAAINICAAVGPEILTGSTRMKAGTAQKLILNMLSTASMIKLGKTFTNLMVDVNASNAKLKARAQRIVVEATGCDEHQALTTLISTNYQPKSAILCILADINPNEATRLLLQHDGFLRHALQAAKDSAPDA